MLLTTSVPNLNSWISQGCYEETITTENAGNPGKFFDKSDADRLMGEPTYLADSSLTREAGVSSYRCSYKAYAADKRTGKTGAVYFLMEQ
ncbi:MAG: hypothetical protein KIT80_04740 [Chitinophagaceae bacterium]|nr:hypothetical protein [Chitinophagaceae bacterium]MCW5926199.1 hypothetical protein [Chitinophagaceae bacterium]